MSSILISPKELNDALSDNLVIIDTRDPDSYAAGHLPGAVNVHEIFTYLATSSPEGMSELTAKFATAFGACGLDGNKTAVLYEESMNSGFGQSCRGYFLLSYLGYPAIRVLHGGLQAWKDESLPLSTDETIPTAVKFPHAINSSLMLTAGQVKQALSDPEIALLDVRDIDEWIGTSSSPYGVDFCPRKGRIPGAVWIEWYRLMKPTASGPMMKSKNEVLAECATVGITVDTPVYIYCFKGARASNSFLALKEAGIKDVRIYFGSWNEWSRDDALPIEEGLPFAETA
jgi:thiosulfate/3-mercaptopyruvate sulfurtransferase